VRDEEAEHCKIKRPLSLMPWTVPFGMTRGSAVLRAACLSLALACDLALPPISAEPKGEWKRRLFPLVILYGTVHALRVSVALLMAWTDCFTRTKKHRPDRFLKPFKPYWVTPYSASATAPHTNPSSYPLNSAHSHSCATPSTTPSQGQKLESSPYSAWPLP
jgi:hypothetical protein